MTKVSTSKKNRTWIITNYLSLIIALGLFYAGKFLDWPLFILLLELVAVFVFIISFVRAFIRNHLWRMVHIADKYLDERELQVVLRALRFSYSIFTITTLAIIYLFAIAEKGPIDVLLAAALVLFAHTLPAAVIGWRERVLIIEQ
jgi:hypothetical protein